MRIPVKSLLCLLAPIILFTCRSADDFQGGVTDAGDSDPSIYFSLKKDAAPRAAVLTFTSAEGIAFFDAFVTDEVIRRLSSAKNLKLVERSRMDLILQEHELAQSGLVSGREALRLGTLLTVDYLVTGSYAYRGEAILVRGRTMDARTAKIESTFAFSIPYRGKKAEIPVESEIKGDKGCESVQRPVLLALRDLSTPAAVERAVDRAIRVPWNKPCGRVHMKVTSEFSAGNLYPRRYHEFLVKTLEAMESPRDEYYTIQEIFSYFARDGNISEFEWAAAREILKKAWHSFHQKYFFKPDRYSGAVIRRRATELLELARKGEIGRPYAYTEYKVASDLLAAPSVRGSEKGIAFSLFLIRSIRNPAGAPYKEREHFFREITDCYEDTLSPEHRRESLDLLIAFMKPLSGDKEYNDKLWHFLYSLEKKMREKPSAYIPHLPYAPADLARINSELRENLCRRREAGEGSYDENDLADYMRRHGVRCPGGR